MYHDENFRGLCPTESERLISNLEDDVNKLKNKLSKTKTILNKISKGCQPGIDMPCELDPISVMLLTDEAIDILK